MILRYRHLKHYPAAFHKLTNLEVAEFEALLADIQPHYHEYERRRLLRAGRVRAVGGGGKYDMELCDRMLLTLVWLEQHPNQEILGYFFGISQPTVWRYIQRVQMALEQAGYEALLHPDPGRKQRRDLAALLEEIPELLVVISDFAQDRR
jgi:hypothetical protein